MQMATLPLGQLTTYPGNPRQGDINTIGASLARRGQYRPIVISADDVILAGNHTYLAARALGWDVIACVRVEHHSSSPEAAEIVLVDNQSARLGDYDYDALADLIATLPDRTAPVLASIGFTELEILKLLPADSPVQLTDPDEVPTLEEAPPLCQPGQFWALGPHRLRVGSNQDFQEWLGADVLITDPPYGLDYQSNKRKKAEQHAKIASDTDTALRDTVLAQWSAAGSGGRPWLAFGTWKVARPTGTGQVLIWDKTPGTGPGMGDLRRAFGTSHEEIYLSAKGWQRDKQGPPRAGSVLTTHVSIGGPGLATKVGHPTPKPVTELMLPLLRVLPAGAIIADPFAGSGSSIIAAHHAGLGAVACELEPRYADLILARWQTHTGQIPILLSTAEFEEIA